MARSANQPTCRPVTVAICGNPNCGKTTIFNAITGLRQKVGNYPGVTVDKVSGQYQVSDIPGTQFELIDIPGSYSLAAFSPDEYIAAQALFGSIKGSPAPDVIVCIIDATQLERGLYLLFQVLQIGRPVVVGLNMTDLARRKGLAIDGAVLSKNLGDIPVVELVGSRRVGIEELKAAIARSYKNPVAPRICFYEPEIERAVNELSATSPNGHRNRAEYLRILFDIGGPADDLFGKDATPEQQACLRTHRATLKEKYGSLSAAETYGLSDRAAAMYKAVVTHQKKAKRTRSDRVDAVLLHPFFGPLILLVLMTFMFQSIFSWAEPIMTMVDASFGWLASQVELLMDPGPLRSLLTDGIIGGVGSVIIFLPQIVILFAFIAIIEDSGYMPRAAFIVDRAFGWCGLSGKSFIPMLSSFACAIPGIMATRTIEDRKLRLMTILVAPLMTCSARLPVYAIMIAAFIPHKTFLGVFNSQGLVLTGLYALGVVMAILVSFVMKTFVHKTERGTFLMEMPSYKIPTLSSVFIRVVNRARSFLFRAGTVIAAITIIVWALSYYPRSPELMQEYDSRRQAAETAYVQETEATTAGLQELITNAETVDRALVDDYTGRIALLESESDVQAFMLSTPAMDSYRFEALVHIAHLRLLAEEYEAEMQVLNNAEAGASLRNSYFARAGKLIEPAFRPLGWDWKITMSTLASFPAREVVIATLGTIFNLGGEEDEESLSLVEKLRLATWEDGPKMGQRVFTPAVALSVMVFFALCCQCGATVVTIRQEAGGWRYAIGAFSYMTILAYVGSFAVYHIFKGVGL